jgi:phage gp45-like
VRHQTSRNSADRHGNALGRTVVEQVDDTKLMQQSKHSLFQDEQQDQIEHVHPYGFVNVPKKPTGSGKLRKAAEAFMSFLGGNRSHGIAMVVGDRRYRLYKLEEGEVALHDDQGHQVHFKRDGVWVSAPNSKKIVAQIMDDDQLPRESGKDMGQIKQAGRPSSCNYTLDKNSLTINHTTAVNINAPTIKMVGSTIIADGMVYLGGEPGDARFEASKRGSIDTNGDSQIDNLSKKVFIK